MFACLQHFSEQKGALLEKGRLMGACWDAGKRVPESQALLSKTAWIRNISSEFLSNRPIMVWLKKKEKKKKGRQKKKLSETGRAVQGSLLLVLHPPFFFGWHE